MRTLTLILHCRLRALVYPKELLPPHLPQQGLQTVRTIRMLAGIGGHQRSHQYHQHAYHLPWGQLGMLYLDKHLHMG